MDALQILCAARQLQLRREYPRLLPRLLRLGVSGPDALALAHNLTLLHHALPDAGRGDGPMALLEQLSLGEIAALCERYEQLEAQTDREREERLP